MASNSNQAGDWADIPQAKGGEDWQDIPHQDPGVTPDDADKASRPKQPYMSPGESASNNYFTNVKDRLLDSNRWAALGKGLTGIGSSQNPALPQNQPGYVKPVGDTGAAALAMPIEAAPEGLAKLASYLNASRTGRVAANAGVGAVQGAVNNPDSPGMGAVTGGLIGGGISGAGEAVSGTAGKLADWLMQKSVGMRKYMPGVGNSLADMGMVGTKDLMASQASNKLADQEAKLQDLVKDLQGNVDSKDIADAVMARGEKFKSPSGITLNGVSSDLDQVTKAAGQFDPSVLGAQGPTQGLNPQDLLSLKRQGDWAGYTASGNPASATSSEIGRTIADKSRELLSGLSEGETAEVLGKERALILAKKALDKPDAMHQGVGSSLFFGKIPGTSLLSSLGAQGLQQGVAKPASLFANPVVVQDLVDGSTRK